MLLTHTRCSRRVMLGLAILATFAAPISVYSVGALAPLLRASLHLSREHVGWLTALFYAGAALASIPAGWLADRWGVRRPLIAVQAVGGVALLMTPCLRTYGAILLVMFVGGLAYGTITVITAKAIYEWFPRTLRATALGTRLAMLPVAGGVASVAVPVVALWGGWRLAFAACGGLMLASALCAGVLYRDPPLAAPGGASPLTVARRRSLLLDRHIWILAAIGFLFGGVKYTSTAYLALFFHESWQLPLAQATSLLAQVHLASAPSYLLYGLLSDRWLHGNRTGLLGGIGVVAAISLGALLLVPPQTPPLVLSGLILLYGLSGLSWGSMYQTLATEVAGGAAAGLGVGISVSLVYAGSTAMAPVFGYVADRTGSYTASWGMLLGCLALGVGLLGALRSVPSRREAPAEKVANTGVVFSPQRDPARR